MEEESDDGARIRREIGHAKEREFKSLGVVLGICYRGSPIIADAAELCDADSLSASYTPSAGPGCLAPHLWIDEDTSLFDLFGAGFTLLATSGLRDDEADHIRRDAEARGVPLTILAPKEERLADLYEARLALIRPDQHVAWRGDRWPGRAVLDLFTG